MQSASFFSQNKRLALSLITLFVLLAIYFFLKMPDPIAYISSPDAGNQTAGAQQIRSGEAPFVNWRSTYGPLRFYLSDIAESLGRQRVGSELALCIAGNSTSYLLFFLCAYRVSRRYGIALAATVVAVLLMPPFTKFYIALCPLLALHQTYAYLASPSRKRVVGMAAAVVFAAAYRVDIGLWALAPCLVAIWLRRSDGFSIGRTSLCLFAWIAAITLPWWIYLVIHGGLRDYLIDSTYYGLGLAKGLSVPYPRFDALRHWYDVNNLAAICFPAAYAASLMLATGLLFRSADMSRIERGYFCITLPIALLAILQTTHRSDFSHLLQGMTFMHLLLAFSMAAALRDWKSRRVVGLRLGVFRFGKSRLVINAVALCFSFLSAALIIYWGTENGAISAPSTTRWNDWKNLYSRKPADFLLEARQRYPDQAIVPLISRIREVIPIGTPFFAAPYLTNLYTMAERKFASGQMYLAPGYFNDRQGQARMVQSLVAEHCPPVIEPVGARYDGDVARTNRAIAPALFAFVESHYMVDPSAALPPPFILWRAKSPAGSCSIP